MFWLILLFVVAMVYWIWVQNDEERRVTEEVGRRKEAWKHEEEARAEERRQKERKAYIELVQRRINKID